MKYIPADSSPTDTLKLFNSNAILVSILAVLTFLLYANTLNSPFAMDDWHNILANKHIRITDLSISTLNDVVTDSLLERRPVANISLALNYYFHQYDVTGYHIVNILIHIINGILLFYFVQSTLVRMPVSRINDRDVSLIAFFTAFLWLVHPLQTQSVTYLIQRMNSLAALFYLLSFILYIRARTSPAVILRWLYASTAFLSGLLAIGSKENAVMLPAFILLYEWYFFQNLKLNFKKQHYLIASLLFLFLLGAVFFYLGPNPLEAMTNYSGRNFTLPERLLTQLRVVVFYISLIVFPLPSRLTLEHDFTLSQGLLDPFTTVISLVILLALLTSALITARRERILSFSILWFFGNLFIESSFIPLEIIFEHRTYLPSMMIVLIIVLTIYRFISRDIIRMTVLITAALLLATATYARNSIWENEISLWTDIAQKAPYKSRAQINLGIILSKEGRMDEAMVYLKRAVELEPDYDISHYSLGNALMKQKKYIQAGESYTRALQIEPNNPLSRFNLGKALAAAGKHQNALYHYQLVADRDQFISHQVYFYMGYSFYKLGKYREAISAYSQALQIKPDYMEALIALQNTQKMMEFIQSRKAPAKQ